MSIYYQPKVKSFSQEPPPFNDLVTLWSNDSAAKDLRLGQWFYNKFIRGGVTGDLKDHIDCLHAERDIHKCQDMIEELYIAYQWPMA